VIRDPWHDRVTGLKPKTPWLVITQMVCWLVVGAAHAETWSATSKSGRYLVEMLPQEPVTIGKSQNWVVKLTPQTNDQGTPNHLSIRGVMRAHGHGLPNAPQFTRYLGGQEFLLEGLKFNMSGHWSLQLSIGDALGLDNAIIEMHVTSSPQALPATDEWTVDELALMDSLRLASLTPLRDASNKWATEPRAQQLGKKLFGDKLLSGTGRVSCATCHQPERAFTDGRALAFGSAQAKRNTPTLLGAASNTWFYWDGRRDSLWSQALSPLETVGEMDNNRTNVVRYFLGNNDYFTAYAQLPHSQSREQLASLPEQAGPFDAKHKPAWENMAPPHQRYVNQVFADVGKLLAAYESTFSHPRSRFDRYASAVLRGRSPNESAYTVIEKQGLKLFLNVNKTHCLRCHNGPLFTNQGFHNIGSAKNDAGVIDFGRFLGRQAASYDTFNCASIYSDSRRCQPDLQENAAHDSTGAFKVPSLRSLKSTAPYFHDGRFATLPNVLAFYQAPNAGSEAPQLDITEAELLALTEFLLTLSPDQLHPE